MADADPWYEGVSAEHRAMVDEVRRLIAWGVTVPGSVNPAFCDAVVERCRSALETDPALIGLVRTVHGIADRQTNDEFVAHGPTTKARLWAGLSDRLHELTGTDAPGGP